MSDLLLQEIDEELRREKAAAFWKRHGKLIVGIVLVFVVLVAGWRGYDSWQRSQQASDGDKLFSLLQQSGQQASNDTIKKLNDFAAKSTKGAAVLARFQSATDEARLGDAAAAVKSFDALSKDGSLAPQLRDLAAIRASMLLLEQSDADGVSARLKPLTKNENEFRHVARETLGLAAYSKKDLAGSARWFEALITDLSCPPATRNRGQMMIALLAAEGMPLAKVRAAENTDMPVQ
ncbi:MAG: tetratricopeptide repeat protein [Pseudomonadota bacterium]